MSPTSCLRRVKNAFFRPRNRVRQPFRHRPQLEWLEQRLAPAAASLNQWANGTGTNPTGSWVNGNLNPQNTQLYEGDNIPFQDLFSGLKTNTQYVFQISWQTTKAGVHGYDYLTSYDYTWNGGSKSGATVDGHELDGSGLPSNTSFTTLAIPTDPNINNSSFPAKDNTMIDGHTPVAGQFVMYGAKLNSASGYNTYDMKGDTYQILNITFTTGSSITNPVLLWGGHIASRLDWGPSNGAASISGSPYHMFQESLSTGGNSVSGVGSQDRSIKTSAIVLPTILVVNKDATPADSSASFSYTNTPSNAFFLPGQPSSTVASFALSDCPIRGVIRLSETETQRPSLWAGAG